MKLIRTQRYKRKGGKRKKEDDAQKNLLPCWNLWAAASEPVCVLCCLMAALVSDWQCANATHSVSADVSEQGTGEKKKRQKKKKKRKKIQNENARSALQRRGLQSCHFFAWTPKNKMLRAST